MALPAKKKIVRPAGSKPRTVSSVPAGLSIDDYEVFLPDEPNVPSESIHDYFIVFFGEKSVGKTTLLYQFPDVHIWMLEPERKNAPVLQTAVEEKSIEVMNEEIKKYGVDRKKYATPWKKVTKDVAVAIQEGRYKTFAFDTLDRLYRYCQEDYCIERNVENLGQLSDFGKSWDLVDQRLEAFFRLIKRERGLLGTSHGKTREITSVSGEALDVKGMSASPRMEGVLRAVSDMQVYYGYDDEGKRVFYVREKHFVKASCGLDGHFLFKPEGEKRSRQIASFFAGNSPKEAYANLNKAFENKMTPVEYVGD